MVHLHHLPPARDDDMCTMCILPASQISRNYSKLVRTLPIEKKANSNKDSFGIHSVKVLVQVHYFFAGCPQCGPDKGIIFEKWVPDRVPTWVPDRVPIRGPEGARKRKINHEVEPRNGCPIGYPYGCPIGCPLRPTKCGR